MSGDRGTRKKSREDRLARIAAQIDRLESSQDQWAGVSEETIPVDSKRTESRSEAGGALPDSPTYLDNSSRFLWETGWGRGILDDWKDHLSRLAQDMRERSKQPFSLRTKQISALAAFIPFVICLTAAIVRYLPIMPSLPFWTKTTFFILLPMFFALVGAFVGFLIGLMLDSIEAQAMYAPRTRTGNVGGKNDGVGFVTAGAVKSSAWVAVEDLEPNQRIAETVIGENGTPILLRHTLLKPAHLELLRNQNITKVKVEVMKYPGDGDFALAG